MQQEDALPDSTTDDAVKQVAGVARAAGEAMGEKVEQVAGRSKAVGADAMAELGRAASVIADSVSEQSPALADYVRGTGEKIDRLASDLRDKKVGDLLSSAAEFGRSQPVVLLAGAALIGFALSRLIKAGVAEAPTRAGGQAGEPQA